MYHGKSLGKGWVLTSLWLLPFATVDRGSKAAASAAGGQAHRSADGFRRVTSGPGVRWDWWLSPVWPVSPHPGDARRNPPGRPALCTGRYRSPNWTDAWRCRRRSSGDQVMLDRRCSPRWRTVCLRSSEREIGAPRRRGSGAPVRRFERPPVSESQQRDGLHVLHAYRNGPSTKRMVMVAMQLRVVFMRSTGCEPCMDLVSLIWFQ